MSLFSRLRLHGALWAILAFAIASLGRGAAQNVLFSVSPNLGYPLTPEGLYTLQAGASADLRLLSASGGLEGIGRLGYTDVIINEGLGGLSLIRLEGGLALPLIRSQAFSLGPTLMVGGYGAFRTGSSPMFNPMAEAGLRAEFRLGNLRLALEPGAEILLARQNGQIAPFLASAGIRLSIALAPGGGTHRALLKVENPAFDPFFPAIYKFYSTGPIGKAVITNKEGQAISDVEVSFFVPTYMDGPQTVATIPAVKAGGTATFPLTALFRNSVLGITETDTAQARIHVKYSIGKDSYAVDWDGSIKIEGRNAILWNDDRIAAAFVTARDPTILKLARNTVASMPKTGAAIPSETFRNATVLFQSLESYGLKYVIDPKGSYATMKGKAEAVDYLQFPVETLTYRSGDCDDLSTLYLAMLESVGIETAFITVPGHIYSAFALGDTLSAVKGMFSDLDKLIFAGDRIWVPIETTSLGKGFAAAWDTGASEWREAERTHSAAVVPVHDAWRVYEPSFISSAEKQDVVAKFPDPSRVGDDYAITMKALAERELAALVKSIQGTTPLAKLTPAAKNRLGGVYARYGALDKAEPLFSDAASSGLAAAVFNLGNLRFLRKDFAGAAQFYAKALSLQPSSADAALGLARASFEAGRYQEAAKAYGQLKDLAPDKAAAFAYLADGASAATVRAADPAARLAVDWSN